METKGVRWWIMCQSTGSCTRGRVPIRFSTYKICNGRNGGIVVGVEGEQLKRVDSGGKEEVEGGGGGREGDNGEQKRREATEATYI